MIGLEAISRQIRRCRKCRLSRSRKKAIPGEGPRNAKLFLVGEAPGREEDLSGRPFVGQAGKVLTSSLEAAGLPRSKVFITSVNKCRPPGNRKPKTDEVAACMPYLASQIDRVRPSIIVVMGQHALANLTGCREGMSKARKKSYLYHGITVVATYHPAAVLYNRRLQNTFRNDIRRAKNLLKLSKPRQGGLKPVRGKRTQLRVSSGCVPWSAKQGFLLIKRRDEGIWVLPKGTVEEDESLELTAMRELKEETGLNGLFVADLGTVSYSFYDESRKVNCEKIVHYYLMRTRQGKVRIESSFEDFRWCDYSMARKLLHYNNDKEILRRAWKVLNRLS